jgi:acyl transferase domain-containing protein
MNPAQNQDASVAIIGMSGRFPGARNLQEFWQNLRDGAESVSFFRDEELQWSPLDGTPAKEGAERVAARAILEDADRFDAAFFNIDPGEAEIIDPQHRVFLECAWEALEDAACQPDTSDGLIGLFAGSSTNTYLLANLLTRRDLFSRAGSFPLIFAGGRDHLPTRVSYKLNLRGPSVNVQTACSTSLVAICIACQNLLNYQCDVALAGGVSISFPQKRAPTRQERGTLAPDGHCRPFDAEAAGTVSGEGVGVVALKRLSDALANRDPIRAVIRGCAINNDGSLKSGYAAPGINGQAEVIAMAQANAGVEPDSVSYIETHGAGDPAGDAIEIAGLTKAFRTRTTATNLCAIGSVKGNIGHLDAAAGAAGLIKTVLALQHRQLPPSLHFQRANPKIDFANSPFWVNDTLRPWPNGRTPRRAGVSSFGIGGTNAHVVLEEAPHPEPSGPSRPWQLLLLSARTHTALETITDNLVQHLRAQPNLSPADVAFTLQVGRKPFGHRRMLLSHTLADAAQALAARDSQRVLSGQAREIEPPVVFLFPGEGAQYVNMTRQIYETEPVFRIELDRCCDILGTHLGLDLREILFPETASVREASQRLNQTFIAQPALFAVEYALARLWMRWGIRPQAMVGHGTGEYVAACLAGVFTLEDALALVAARARLIQEQPTGAMLGVPLPEQEVRILLGRKLSLAAVNSPSCCVASGPVDAIEILEKKLRDRGVRARRLAASHALHSEMMEPVLHWFAAKVRKANLNPPGIPYVSNLTGTWITPREATDPNCWVAHLRQTVRFADGLAEVARCGDPFCLEVGPEDALTVVARQHASLGPRTVLQSLGPQPEDKPADVVSMLHALGRLWLGGVTVDWSEFHVRQRRRRVPLPTYPFERKRYWIEPANSDPGNSALPVNSPGNPADSPVRKEPEHSHGATSKPTTMPEDAPRRRQNLGSSLQRLAQAGRLLSRVTP